jgi:tripartite-type tricarboxylate transporter receptor subunit TctC
VKPHEISSRPNWERKRMTLRTLIVTAGLLLLLPAGAAAADWPTKPVRIVVPFAAGGSADVVSRLVADALSSAFGQQFVIDNRAGGGGVVADRFVAHAEPDGYTLIQAGMSSHVIAPAMVKDPGFDPVRDFTHIAFIGGAPSVLMAHPSLGVHSLKELIALARSHNEGIEYVSAGIGTVGNIVAEYVAQRDHIKLRHVPYKGGSGAVVDLLAGRVKVGALNWTTGREHIASGALIGLAVSSAKRLAVAPDLPTFAELGYPDVATTTWHALSGPPGLAPEIVERLNRAVVAFLSRPDIRRRFDADGMETMQLGPAEVTQFIRAQVELWSPIIRATVKSQ